MTMITKPIGNLWKSGLCVLALAGLMLAPAVQAGEQLIASHEMPVALAGIVDVTDCQNSGGPQVTLGGALALGGLQLEVTLKNNAKGTHKTEVLFATDLVLIPAGEAITIPKQPVRGGAGGNPHIWIQFHYGQGHNLTDEGYLGRCVQGLEISADLLNDVLAVADLDILDCRNHQGPYITLSGEVMLSGLHARFIFRNNMKGTHEAEEMRDVQIIGDGTTIRIPKQPVRGGVGGNPIISVRFLDGAGEPIGEEIELGRCNKL